MTVQEAIETIKYASAFNADNSPLTEALEIAIAALKKQLKSKWIPTEECLPGDDRFILLSFANFTLPMVGRYQEHEDGSGNFYLGDCDEEDTCLANDLIVNAWMPLPEPYREDDKS